MQALSVQKISFSRNPCRSFLRLKKVFFHFLLIFFICSASFSLSFLTSIPPQDASLPQLKKLQDAHQIACLVQKSPPHDFLMEVFKSVRQVAKNWLASAIPVVIPLAKLNQSLAFVSFFFFFFFFFCASLHLFLAHSHTTNQKQIRWEISSNTSPCSFPSKWRTWLPLSKKLKTICWIIYNRLFLVI